MKPTSSRPMTWNSSNAHSAARLCLRNAAPSTKNTMAMKRLPSIGRPKKYPMPSATSVNQLSSGRITLNSDNTAASCTIVAIVPAAFHFHAGTTSAPEVVR